MLTFTSNALRQRAKKPMKSTQASLRRWGIEVSRSSSRKPGTVDALSFVLRTQGYTLLLDIGANEGEFVNEVRAGGFAGRALSFEPRPDAYAILADRSKDDPLWTAFPVALGEVACDVPFNVAQNGVSSSMLDMSELHTAAAPSSKYVASKIVRQERLDDVVTPILRPWERLAIKLDVQGYERSVMAGGAAIMKMASAVHIELSLAPVYEGQPEWRELVSSFLAMGFTIYAAEPVFCDPVSARTLQMDALLVR